MPSIYGIQATIANRLKPFNFAQFIYEMMRCHNDAFTEREMKAIVVDMIIASFRFANHLDIDVEEAINERIRELKNG